MDNSYTQIKLIECNRAGSIEAKANQNDNPALFTNEISEGFTLQPLDIISVHSSYVSEVGVSGDTVEVKGDFIKNFTFEGISEFEPLVIEFTNDEGDIEYATAEYYPDNISFIDARTVSNVNKPLNIYDNQLKIPIQYYKNNNGENHVYLPRNYNYHFTTSAENHKNWSEVDNRTTGMTKSAPNPNYILLDDYRYDGTNYKLKTDNKRFTALVRRKTIYNASYFQKFNSSIVINPDPAGDEYILYQELIELEAPVGFNNPSKIADLLTQQLKQVNEPQQLKVSIGTPAQIENILTILNGKTFKSFTACNYDSWTEAVFNTFNTLNNASYDQKTLDHYNSYEFVFHKRPEIQIAGRRLNDVYGLQLGQQTDPADDNKRHIYLELTFTDDNCKRILDLFDAEALYPEIWTNDNVKNYINVYANINNSRFIHINKNVNASQVDLNGLAMLGNDGYTAYPTGLNLASLPLFVYYKDNERDVTCAEATATNTSYDVNTTTYAYGFAIPWIRDGETQKRIALNARNVGPNIGHHYLNASGIIEANRKIGFDNHFNAYSTAALILTSGVTLYEADSNIATSINLTHPISKYFTGAYIGATNPKLEYDAINNQFSFSGLHSPENEGQTAAYAGDTVTGAAETTSNPETEVYRINKNLNYSNYTPDGKPYRETESASWANHSRTIAPKNINIEAWTIFDSRSGIYFTKDIGLDEEEFNKSLFKTLGFNYNQWEKPDIINDSNNRQIRVDNNTYNNLDLITTNAEIVSDISTTFDINFYGARYFNHIIAHCRFVDNEVFYPIITNNAISYKFKADFLARRMLKPYYTIRSSLIDDNVQYIGNSKNPKAKMPIIAVVNKINGEGDFYFGEGSDFEFVVTQEKTITSIQTALLDPDASYIKCNNDSAVIYKIQRKITNNFSIAEQILLNQAKKK